MQQSAINQKGLIHIALYPCNRCLYHVASVIPSRSYKNMHGVVPTVQRNTSVTSLKFALVGSSESNPFSGSWVPDLYTN